MYHLTVKRILSLYIIREISSLFLLGIVIFTLVLLMGRLIALTDLVVSRGVPLADVSKMILFVIPSLLVVTIPMAFLLAVLLALVIFDALLLGVGLRQFRGKAVT